MRLRTVTGFTLIEVLVAVFVLAIGLIGGMAAQTTALRTRHATAQLSDGVQLASAFADRMRANATQMQGADGANRYLQVHYQGSSGAPAAPATLCYAGAACSSEQLADVDIYELKQALHRAFPGGRAVVCRDATMWDSTRGALSWDCNGGAAAPVVIKLGWRSRLPDGRPAMDTAGELPPQLAIVVGTGAP